MQYGDLEKAKVLKTQRDSKSDVRKPNFKSVLKYVLPVRPVLHICQTGWTYPKASPVHRTCLVPLLGPRDIYRTCPILDQTSPVNNMTIGIWTPLDNFSLHRTCPGPNPNLPIQRVPWASMGSPYRSNRYALTAPTASFPDYYKRHSTPSLIGCWFVTVSITI
jgi:hypothetical protein